MDRIKLFLSYGRRDAEQVASRLKNDLDAMGYEVWMDQSELKAGTAWMKEIEKALNESRAMLALLSPHAVRIAGVDGSGDDSVCLDEIAYARDHPGKILPIMVADCNVPFILYRLHYVDLRHWQGNEDAYQQGLREVVQSIEAALKNEIQYNNLDRSLKPLDFTPFLEERRRGFTGRHWLFSEVREWLEGEHHEHCLLIAGDPGIGKSAFVAQWVHLNPGGHLLAYYCCQIDSPNTLEPHSFIRSIAAMIASQIPEYAEKLLEPVVSEALTEDKCRQDPGGSFDTGILSPLNRITAPEKGIYCILIDALDEAILKKEGTTIVDVIADRLYRLPGWLRIVATTRKDPNVLKKLERLRAAKLDTQDPRNMKDAKEFIENKFRETALSRLLRETGVSLNAAVDMLMQRSRGNFLYIHYALEGLETGNFHLNRPNEFPPGLNGFYDKAFQRRFISKEEYAPAAGILSTVLASREPLKKEILQAASGLDSERELNRILKKLAIYLPEKEGTYSLFHRSLGEWLRDSYNNEEFCVETGYGERKLADLGWLEYQQNGSDLSPYMLKNLPFHLAATGQWEKLTALLTDFSILDIAWKTGGEHVWMMFWRKMMDQVDMVAAYQQSIDKLLLTGAEETEIAAVTRQVGVLLRKLGLFGQALPFAEKALELIKKDKKDETPELASALFDLAETCHQLKQFDRAESCYLEALRIREHFFDPESTEVGEVIYALCVFYNTCTKRDIEKSIQFNERAIMIREKQDPPDFAALADAVNDKGVLLSAKGEYDKTLPYFVKAKELFEQGFPDGHPELGVVLTNIGDYYYRQQDYENAAIMYLTGLQMRSMFVVPYDEKCQRARRDLIITYRNMGRYDESLKWAKEVVNCASNDPFYSIEKRLSDLSLLIEVAAIANRNNERDKFLEQFVKLIGNLPYYAKEYGWEYFAFTYLNLIKHEINRENPKMALLLFEKASRLLASASPRPYLAMARLESGMAEIAGILNQSELKDKLNGNAEKNTSIAVFRSMILNELYEVERLISAEEYTKAVNLAIETFSEARNDPENDAYWKRTLSNRANDFALQAKNEKINFEVARTFYQIGISIDPSNSTLLGNYAFFLTSVCGENDEAYQYYEKALQINPEDANCLSNFAVFHTHILHEYTKAEELFARANSIKSPYTDSILGNYAALRIVLRDYEGARIFAAQSREACLRNIDRLIARPIFCAAAIAALSNQDVVPYLAQIKSLFLMGIRRVPWQANALIDYLRDHIDEKSFSLLHLVWEAICFSSADQELEQLEKWNSIRPMPVDKPWSS